jgi:hypothetical protein
MSGTADVPEAVRAAVAAWAAAIAGGDAAGACALMTGHARRQLCERQGGVSCEDAIERIVRALGPGRAAELRAVAGCEVRLPAAGRAVATLGGAGGPELGLELRDGRWLVGDLMTAVRAGGGGSFPPPPVEWLPRPPAAP